MTHVFARRLAVTLLAAACALPAAGCRETTISRILAEPQRFRDDDVGLKGDVVESISLLGHGVYKLDDGTGTIWVVSTRGVPRRGARVAVKGRIRDVVDVGSVFRLPEQVGSGLVLHEDRHKGI